MDEKTVKIGIVGIGRGVAIGQALLRIREEVNARIVAICDLNQERIDSCKKLWKKEGFTDFEVYYSYEEMLSKADINAVVVSTGLPSHVEHSIMALRAGKHVISEIPAFATLEEARQLKTEVLAHPELKYMVAENCCYWAFIETWKRMREDGKFGQIVYAEGEYLHSGDPDKFKPISTVSWRGKMHGINYLTHELGPLLYIMDDRCVSVSCLEPDVKYNPYRKTPATGVAIFKTAKGAVIRIFICFGAYAGYDHNFALYGTRGSILTDKTKPLEDAHSFAKLYEVPGTMEAALEIPVGMAYPGETLEGHGGAEPKMMREFVDCILNDVQPKLNIDKAIQMSLPGILAQESAAQGGAAVEIPEL